MTLKGRLIALDRKTLGPAYDANDEESPRWVPVVGGMAPLLTGGSASIAYFIDRGAGVGVMVGILAAVPLCLLARESGRRSSWASRND